MSLSMPLLFLSCIPWLSVPAPPRPLLLSRHPASSISIVAAVHVLHFPGARGVRRVLGHRTMHDIVGMRVVEEHPAARATLASGDGVDIPLGCCPPKSNTGSVNVRAFN